MFIYEIMFSYCYCDNVNLLYKIYVMLFVWCYWHGIICHPTYFWGDMIIDRLRKVKNLVPFLTNKFFPYVLYCYLQISDMY